MSSQKDQRKTRGSRVDVPPSELVFGPLISVLRMGASLYLTFFDLQFRISHTLLVLYGQHFLPGRAERRFIRDKSAELLFVYLPIYYDNALAADCLRRRIPQPRQILTDGAEKEGQDTHWDTEVKSG